MNESERARASGAGWSL